MNAYSEDLREKIIEALRRGMGKSQAARTFSVSLSSLKRYTKLAEKGRSLAPKKAWLQAEARAALQQAARREPQGASFHHPPSERCEYLWAVAPWKSVAPPCAEP